MQVILPWPSKALSPNARGHWSKRNDANAKARSDAYYTAKDAASELLSGPLLVSVQFFPPDRRKRDQDNAFASCKAYFDGIAQAIGVDDSEWSFHLSPMGEPRKGGQVVIEVSQR